MDLKENRLYRNKADSNKVVVVKEIRNDEVTFLHAPPMNSDIHWLVPPQRETMSLSEFKFIYESFTSKSSWY